MFLNVSIYIQSIKNMNNVTKKKVSMTSHSPSAISKHEPHKVKAFVFNLSVLACCSQIVYICIKHSRVRCKSDCHCKTRIFIQRHYTLKVYLFCKRFCGWFDTNLAEINYVTGVNEMLWSMNEFLKLNQIMLKFARKWEKFQGFFVF